MPLAGTESALKASISAAVVAELNTAFPVAAENGINPADRTAFADAVGEAVANTVIAHFTAQTNSVIGTCPVGGGPLTLGKLV